MDLWNGKQKIGQGRFHSISHLFTNIELWNILWKHMKIYEIMWNHVKHCKECICLIIPPSKKVFIQNCGSVFLLCVPWALQRSCMLLWFFLFRPLCEILAFLARISTSTCSPRTACCHPQCQYACLHDRWTLWKTWQSGVLQLDARSRPCTTELVELCIRRGRRNQRAR